ncbi:arf-GAP domain and FG repeat-containing protein 1a isoform X2 [Gadus chalcogrammus]|uniref:arf-GAP domain and FG repeat-containing protein 1a isoform X2 n=1 Tax=Gadus chalcogrammus TaxID=1042646 RepID=UPI0024C4C861|nr:arf-GAP domain and FG repeat-containing protein 1a isoform X2 [Gadus chalcogrammus]
MAASAKRKQEEKHLKMLREMTSLPPNRKCFDCDQRGPTYANMTVGSFVCTSCSGILRGINPPHRVKSISMTTFTQQEIEFLQKHGNEVCKHMWLGLYDERATPIPDFRDPQKVKEFLQEKYEKKRWYVPPDQAKAVASVHASGSSNNSSTSSTPEVRPLKSLLGESAPSLHLNKNTPPNQSPVVSRAAAHHHHQQHYHDKKFDLLSDLGGDIFAAPANPHAGSSANFANFAHFNSHPTAQNATANADFANFDAFSGTSGGSGGAFNSAPPASFQPTNTAFTVLSSSQSMGSASGGLASTNFANFDHFPTSCSADFGTFSSSASSSQGHSAASAREPLEGSSAPADRYAALAHLDSDLCSSTDTEQGSGIAGGVSNAAPGGGAPGAGAGPPGQAPVLMGGDRYAALAALDTVFSPPAPATSVYNPTSTSQGGMYGSGTAVSSTQAQQGLPNMGQGFGPTPTNPFAAAPPAAATNPFQSNGRAAAVAAAGMMGVYPGQGLAPAAFASFGTGSLSMPSGFGNSSAYNLPTSFSGTFQQQFPGQPPFPQPQAYAQQPNGGGFAAFGQVKPVPTPYGHAMAAPGVSSNPFLAGAPAAQYPAGGSSTNPFL